MKTKKLSAKWQVSTMYLTACMCFSIVDGILPLYLAELQMAESQIGLIMGIGYILSVFTAIMWGILNDFSKMKKYIFLFIGITMAIASALLGYAKQFMMFFLLKAVFDSFSSGILPLLDKRALWIQEKYKIPYSKMRMFGSLGFSVILLPTMYLIDKFDSYKIGFYAGMLCMFVFSIVVMFLSSNKEMSEESDTSNKGKLIEEIRSLIAHPSVRILILVYMLALASDYTINLFQGIHLVQTLHAPNTAVPIAVFVASFVSEIPALMLAPKLHERLGWWRSCVFALIVLLIRYFIELSASSWIIFIGAKLIYVFFSNSSNDYCIGFNNCL